MPIYRRNNASVSIATIHDAAVGLQAMTKYTVFRIVLKKSAERGPRAESMKEFKHQWAADIAGVISFGVILVSFSGIFADVKGPLRILDFQTFIGSFGTIINGAQPGIVGSGGYGIKEGFFQAINMAPNMIFSVAFIAVAEHFHGLRMAQKLLTPILKPLAGIPGVAAGVLITNWQSSDASAGLTLSLYQDGLIKSDERDIITAYCFVAAATIGVFFSVGAMMFPYLVISTGPLLLLLMVMKFVSANLMRLYIFLFERNSGNDAQAQEGGHV